LLARAAKSDGKYGKLVTVFLTLVLAMSGLVLSPAHATAPIDGEYVCTTGVIKTTQTTPTFSIIDDSVFLGEFCSGAVVIPLGVTGIGDYAFFMATSLTSITIPASVTSIGASAFHGAIKLTSVYFLGNAPNAVVDDPFDQDSFDGVASGAKAYIKSGVTGFGTTGRWAGLVVTTGVKASASVKPTVSGTAKVSKTLTANKGTWTGYPTPSAFTYQWYSCTKQVNAATQTIPSTCQKITGATKNTLKLASAQKGKYLAVAVTGTSTGTTATKWLSKSTTIVK
jgi:hypothetical protein